MRPPGDPLQWGHLVRRCRGDWPFSRQSTGVGWGGGGSARPARPRSARPRPRRGRVLGRTRAGGRAAEPGEGRPRAANGTRPPHALPSPPLPGAWGPRAAAAAAAGRPSLHNRPHQLPGSKIAARSSRLTPPPTRSQPAAPPARRLPISILLWRKGNALTLHQIPPRPVSTSAHGGKRWKCRLAATSPFHTTPSTTCKDSETGASPATPTDPSRPEHPARPLGAASRGVCLRGRGSTSRRGRPSGFREPVRLSPGPAREYLDCAELQLPARTGPRATGRILRAPPPSGSRLPRFLLHRYGQV